MSPSERQGGWGYEPLEGISLSLGRALQTCCGSWRRDTSKVGEGGEEEGREGRRKVVSSDQSGREVELIPPPPAGYG